MRALIIVIVVIVVLVLVGWITFSRGPDRTTINLETDKIERDTQSVLETGAQTLDKAKRAIDAPDVETPSDEPYPSDRAPERSGQQRTEPATPPGEPSLPM
jgi:hypothetical protein